MTVVIAGRDLVEKQYTVITGRLTNVVLMLDQRCRRWANIKITLCERFVFADEQLDTSTYRLSLISMTIQPMNWYQD